MDDERRAMSDDDIDGRWDGMGGGDVPQTITTLNFPFDFNLLLLIAPLERWRTMSSSFLAPFSPREEEELESSERLRLLA